MKILLHTIFLDITNFIKISYKSRAMYWNVLHYANLKSCLRIDQSAGINIHIKSGAIFTMFQF